MKLNFKPIKLPKVKRMNHDITDIFIDHAFSPALKMKREDTVKTLNIKGK